MRSSNVATWASTVRSCVAYAWTDRLSGSMTAASVVSGTALAIAARRVAVPFAIASLAVATVAIAA